MSHDTIHAGSSEWEVLRLSCVSLSDAHEGPMVKNEGACQAEHGSEKVENSDERLEVEILNFVDNLWQWALHVETHVEGKCSCEAVKWSLQSRANWENFVLEA